MKKGKEKIEKELLEYINDSLDLQSLLYDMNYLPEQLAHNSKEWFRMLMLTERWKDLNDKKEEYLDDLLQREAQLRYVLSDIHGETDETTDEFWERIEREKNEKK